MKRVIITGDDFGLAVPVNEAIETSHRQGVLTAASLMVGAAAAADAVERARRLPRLGVGLHLVLVEGRAVLPAAQIPALVDLQGEFSRHRVRSGFNFVLRPGARRQLEAEIRAQFEAFRRTGLPLDHVNAHNHMHLHPEVLRLILKIGPEYGLRAVRLPFEPPLLSWRATGTGLAGRLAGGFLLAPWIRLLKARLGRAGVRINDRVFGMAESGNMTAEVVKSLIARLPEGVTEMYFHPATRPCPETARDMPRYRHVDEFRALVDPAVADSLIRAGAQRIVFADL